LPLLYSQLVATEPIAQPEARELEASA
jgi:hypothetical protein